jgi:hypothetical protein
VNSGGASLAGDDPCGLERILVASRRRDGHRRRKHGRAPRVEQVVREEPALQPAQPRLEIRRHEQRQCGTTLEIVDLGRDFDGSAERHRHAADVIAFHPADDLRVRRVAGARVVAQHPHHHHLRDAVAERQRGQRSVDPLTLARRERRQGIEPRGRAGLGWCRRGNEWRRYATRGQGRHDHERADTKRRPMHAAIYVANLSVLLAV